MNDKKRLHVGNNWYQLPRLIFFFITALSPKNPTPRFNPSTSSSRFLRHVLQYGDISSQNKSMQDIQSGVIEYIAFKDAPPTQQNQRAFLLQTVRDSYTLDRRYITEPEVSFLSHQLRLFVPKN